MAQLYIDNFLRPFYQLEKWTNPNNVISQGAVASNIFAGTLPDDNLGYAVTRTFDKDISRDMTFAMVEDETSAAPIAVGMSSYKATLPVLIDATQVKATNFEAIRKGQGDKESMIMQKMAQLREGILLRQQTRIKQLIDTAFDATDGALKTMVNTTYNASSFNGSNLRKALIDMKGEKALNSNNFNEIIVSPTTYEQMRSDNLINYAPASSLGLNLFGDPNVSIFDQKRIIVNATLCAISGSSYPVYVTSNRAIGIETIADIKVTDIPAGTGGGQINKVLTFGFSPAIYGLTYGTSTVTQAEFVDPTNWTCAWDISEIDLVRIDFGA
jgi:hypothetical protein